MYQMILNALGRVDRTFFIICGVIVVVLVAIYFLMPVINRKQYEQARENLKKREASFKGNLNKNVEPVDSKPEKDE